MADQLPTFVDVLITFTRLVPAAPKYHRFVHRLIHIEYDVHLLDIKIKMAEIQDGVLDVSR